MNTSRFCSLIAVAGAVFSSTAITHAGEMAASKTAQKGTLVQSTSAGEKTAFLGLLNPFCGSNCRPSYGGGYGCGQPYGGCRPCNPCGQVGYPGPVCRPYGGAGYGGGYGGYGNYYGVPSGPAPVYGAPVYGNPGYGSPAYTVPSYSPGYGNPYYGGYYGAEAPASRKVAKRSSALNDDSPFFQDR